MSGGLLKQRIDEWRVTSGGENGKKKKGREGPFLAECGNKSHVK